MSATINKVVNDTITLALMLTRKGVPVTGQSPTVELRRNQDGRYFDWAAVGAPYWKTIGGSKETLLVERPWLGGYYTKTWNQETYDPDVEGDYTAIYRNTAAPNIVTTVELFAFRASKFLEELVVPASAVAGSAAEYFRLILGLVQQNYILDLTSYNAVGLLTAGRIRIFDTAANLPVTGGGSETTGLLATYNITTVAKVGAADEVDYYRVVKV
jgi:hypothetical protein